jgi:hypothetical protein
MLSELPSPPGNDRLRLNEDEGIAPAGPESGEPGPEEAIGLPDTKSIGCSLVDSELLPKGKDLGLHGSARSELVPEERCDEEHELRHSQMLR